MKLERLIHEIIELDRSIRIDSDMLSCDEAYEISPEYCDQIDAHVALMNTLCRKLARKVVKAYTGYKLEDFSDATETENTL